VRGLFDVTRSFIERAGLEANVLAVHRSKVHGRYQALTPALLRLMQNNELKGFALAHVPPPEVDAVQFGWVQGGTTTDAFTVTGRTQFFSPTPDEVISLALKIAQVFPFTYGYQYVIDAAYGPGFHAIGMFYRSLKRKDVPPLSETEERRTEAWCNNKNEVVPFGLLRDVFPINFLTDVHRKRLVGGTPLLDWIAQDDSRGRIDQLRQGLWAWHVPDERCVELGDTLERWGLLATMTSAPN
jgi:hypothetical protein